MSSILIVEDDEFLRTLITKKLSQEGYSVNSSADGEDGLEKIRGLKPDLVLLDLLLPEMDGFEVLSAIKEDKSIASTSVIVVLSNLNQKEDIDRAMKLGAKDYLIKAQITPEEIVNKVREIFSKK